MDWLVTMYTLFGNKWAKLHRGPMWEGCSLEQTGPEKEGTKTVSIYVHVCLTCMH